MGRHRNSSRHDHRAHCTGNKEVVDDGTAGSFYPSSLLFWLNTRKILIQVDVNLVLQKLVKTVR